jgi:hypothetical protein
MQSLTTWIAITAFAALAFICIQGFIRSRRQPADELMFTTETMQSRADRKEKRPNLGITTLSGRQSPTFSRSHLTDSAQPRAHPSNGIEDEGVPRLPTTTRHQKDLCDSEATSPTTTEAHGHLGASQRDRHRATLKGRACA